MDRFDKIRFFEDNCIVIDDCYSPSTKKRNIDNYINKHAKGVISQDNDISYLVEIPNLLYLSVPRDVENVNVILQLKDLKALKFYSSAFNKIDLSELKSLEHLHIIEDEKLSDLRLSKSITSIFFQRYSAKDLFPLKSINQIRELYIENSSKLISIEGIENLTNLKLVSFDYCTQLRSIETISVLSNTIRALRVMECNKVENFDFLNVLKELKNIFVIYSHSKKPVKLPNLEFVKSTKLDEYICNFRIEDGNLKPLLQINHAEVFKFYSNYNLNDKDLPKRYVAYKDSEYTGKKVLLSDLKLGKDDPNIIWSR